MASYLPVQWIITAFLFRRETLLLFLRIIVDIRRAICKQTPHEGKARPTARAGRNVALPGGDTEG